MKLCPVLFLSVFAALCFVSAPVSSESWYGVWFTTPEKNGKHGTFSPPEEALVALVDSAKRTLDGAFFEIGSKNVSDAFIRAHKRGVSVRLVTDDSNLDRPALKKVKAAGIPVIDDGKKGLMHDKFAIVDGKTVWTGSYNITDNCAYRNNNNALRIESPELAAIYEAEFREMFEDRIFENKKEKKPFGALTNPYYVKIGDTNINAYFSPDNDVEDIIVKRLKKAKSSICFLAFSFTSDPIGEAMIAQSRKGVKVAGVFEKNGSDTKESEYRKMLVEKIPVVTDRNPRNMHHKVIIIDEETVITGSYNFSKNASKRNDENTLIIEDRQIASIYLAEFRKIYSAK
jgi:phosphatidylserine/phosphatidylglycerophosphate/cardiolipin synthase-like enzyme